MRLIDADLLKRQMESVCMGIMAGTDSYGAPLKTIDNAPRVDTVKHGHWELSPFDGNWACSNCGNKPYHDNMKNMNYCPNCGYKMDEVKNNDSI